MSGETPVAIAAIALAGTSIGGVIWALKYFAKTLSHNINENTKSNIELKTYLKERNGRDNEMHKERMNSDARQVKQEQVFYSDMITHMKDLKTSDIQLAEAVGKLKGKGKQ